MDQISVDDHKLALRTCKPGQIIASKGGTISQTKTTHIIPVCWLAFLIKYYGPLWETSGSGFFTTVEGKEESDAEELLGGGGCEVGPAMGGRRLAVRSAR